MKPITQISLATTLLFSLSAGSAHAALYDRGNGMIYDSTQDITWLQDAGYMHTSGYNPFGSAIFWSYANNWATKLVYAGHSGWRLPTLTLIGDTHTSYDSSTDFGYNNTNGELGHLFFELGNKSLYDKHGNIQSGYGLVNTSFIDAATGKTVSFLNVGPSIWYDLPLGENNNMWEFDTSVGVQQYFYDGNLALAWAVHDGDIANVSSVPVPAAAWLFGSGLIGLVGASRRKAA